MLLTQVNMLFAYTQIKGLPLTHQPNGITQCGMSGAQFAKNCRTRKWYKISTEGPVIGTPTDFDFYRQVSGKRPEVANEKTLASV